MRILRRVMCRMDGRCVKEVNVYKKYSVYAVFFL